MESRKDYENKRNDPVRWARYLEQDKIRKARIRERMQGNPEFNDHIRQLQREGCKRYRERVKAINERLKAEFGHLSIEEREAKRKELTEQERAERKKELSTHKNRINKEYRERLRVAACKPKKEKATPEELKRRKAERNRIMWAKIRAAKPPKQPKPPVALCKPKADVRIGTSGVAHMNITRRTTMTKDEVAEYLGVSTGELVMMTLQGKAPRPVGVNTDGETVYDREEVEKAKDAPDETPMLHFEKAPGHTKRKGYRNDTYF